MKKQYAKIICMFIPFPTTRRRLRERLIGGFEYEWRRTNAHNDTSAENHFDVSRVSVGVGTYGPLNVYMAGKDGKLKIGNYCSIAPGVKFLVCEEHPYRGFSTYPFKVKLGLQKYEAKSKGNIIIDDDVWIGLDAIINSGVHIGRGAIIASGAVITHDVEPYSIVGGNPAKHIKYRFPETIRKKLMKIDFANLDTDKIAKSIDVAYTELTEKNVDKIIATITKQKG